MINLYHASQELLNDIEQVNGERELISLVTQSLEQYRFVSSIYNQELDLAYAATGGAAQWYPADAKTIRVDPKPPRQSTFGDILVEAKSGYVNLATPAGFIPLVDVEQWSTELRVRVLN